MRKTFASSIVKLSLSVVIVIVTIWLVRAFDSRRLPDLKVWHTLEISHEFKASDRSAEYNYEDYLATEQHVFDELAMLIERRPHPEEPQFLNRYSPHSPLNPSNHERNWNRSFELRPEHPVGGILLLHGLTDSPYSVRALAEIFFNKGYYVLAPRMPGHGTLPGELRRARIADWQAVIELAVPHLRQIIGDDRPFLLGGYSNGGLLALDYVLASLERVDFETPKRLYLFSPALAVSEFAALANWHKVLSKIPYFHKFQWESVLPEYDPYKYNSFPKQAGAETYELTRRVHAALTRHVDNPANTKSPAVLAFQSLVDSTVKTDAVVNKLFDYLQDDRHELVLFDVNRFSEIRMMFNNEHMMLIDELREAKDQNFSVTLVTNVDSGKEEVVAITKSDDTMTENRLNYSWPTQVYSLSHVAVPIRPDDPLYGGNSSESVYGINLGSLVPRGEKNVLGISKELLMRLRYNPFFGYMQDRIEATLAHVE
jgi:alpha-beta hydrolase superfamily lysophospholipase